MEEAEREFYRNMAPEDRLALTFELCWRQYHEEYSQGLARVYKLIKFEDRRNES